MTLTNMIKMQDWSVFTDVIVMRYHIRKKIIVKKTGGRVNGT
ncbi:hypothetical protein [Nitrosopumilus sp.]|nr:hypothetical protein [Nitrosopumilus sp.]